ncbi:hypothetical protein ACE38W_17880 [Chitinophaga sp. Hz27]|uniref:hypothetical protein n=1 Tax=Chitinophaga sp. Hz27 TaxID=3347169 RepID=UPI0035E0E8E9
MEILTAPTCGIESLLASVTLNIINATPFVISSYLLSLATIKSRDDHQVFFPEKRIT